MVDQPQVSQAVADLIPRWRDQIAQRLAEGGPELVDWIVALVAGNVEENRQAAAEAGYVAGREDAERQTEEAIRKARANGALNLEALARQIAQGLGAEVTVRAILHVSRLLAELLEIQRATDVAIMYEEAKRRELVANAYPDLAPAALASIGALKVAAHLIQAGMVPEDVATTVAAFQIAQREKTAAAAPQAHAAAPAKGRGKGRKERGEVEQMLTVGEARAKALRFLVEVHQGDLKDHGLTLNPNVHVETAADGPIIRHVVGIERRTYQVFEAEAVALALLRAVAEARGEWGMR